MYMEFYLFTGLVVQTYKSTEKVTFNTELVVLLLLTANASSGL